MTEEQRLRAVLVFIATYSTLPEEGENFEQRCYRAEGALAALRDLAKREASK